MCALTAAPRRRGRCSGAVGPGLPARNWKTFFCGPHAIHHHIEHHQYVRVPFYRLPALHRWMHAQGQLPAANLYRGYVAVLKEVSRVVPGDVTNG